MTNALSNVIAFPGTRMTAKFSSSDLMELRCWRSEGRHVEIDDLSTCDELGQFAMIHENGQAWASWAISREAGRVLLWDCISHADIGRFPSMRAALAAVPHDRSATAAPALPQAEIIMLRAIAPAA